MNEKRIWRRTLQEIFMNLNNWHLYVYCICCIIFVGSALRTKGYISLVSDYVVPEYILKLSSNLARSNPWLLFFNQKNTMPNFLIHRGGRVIHRDEWFNFRIATIQAINDPVQNTMLIPTHFLPRLQIRTEHPTQLFQVINRYLYVQTITKISFYFLNLKMQKKSEFRSIEETLGLLKYMQNDQIAFNSRQYQYVPARDQKDKTPRIKKYEEESIPQFLPRSNTQISRMSKESGKLMKKEQEENSDEQKQKKLANKNRAIKRIIQTSKEILEKNYQYIQPYNFNEKKSYMTQYNIYMKQYNRLNEQIRRKYKEREELEMKIREQEEADLENIYGFTVTQDYRELIDTNILKQKISRENIDMMMQYFSKMLVCIKKNELRLYFGENEDCEYRAFKLVEIGNVDYHTQPFFLTILTITDKSKGQEYIYFMFKSLSNQNKLDRALYCNFMTRKMKKKQKYFQIEYPQKENNKEEEEEDNNEAKMTENINKGDNKSKHYEVSRRKIIQEISDGGVSQYGGTGTEAERDFMTSGKKENKLSRNNTENFKITPRQNQYRPNTVRNNENQLYQSSHKSKMKQSNHLQVPPEETEEPNADREKNTSPSKSRKMSMSKLFPDWIQTHAKTDNTSPTRLQTTAKPVENPLSEISNDSIQKQNTNIFQTDSQLIDNTNSPKNYNQPSIRQTKKQYEPSKHSSITFINNPDVHKKIQIKQKYQDGIILLKSKFFGDKNKIFYLTNEGYEYWDYDPKIKHRQERKTIFFTEIKNLAIKEKQKSLTFELKKKQMTFNSKEEEPLYDMVDWYDLYKKEKEEVKLSSSGKMQDKQ